MYRERADDTITDDKERPGRIIKRVFSDQTKAFRDNGKAPEMDNARHLDGILNVSRLYVQWNTSLLFYCKSHDSL